MITSTEWRVACRSLGFHSHSLAILASRGHFFGVTPFHSFNYTKLDIYNRKITPQINYSSNRRKKPMQQRQKTKEDDHRNNQSCQRVCDGPLYTVKTKRNEGCCQDRNTSQRISHYMLKDVRDKSELSPRLASIQKARLTHRICTAHVQVQCQLGLWNYGRLLFFDIA